MVRKHYAAQGALALGSKTTRARTRRSHSTNGFELLDKFDANRPAAKQPRFGESDVQIYEQWLNSIRAGTPKSFVKALDFPSMGTCSIVRNDEGTGFHHLLSRGESDLYILLKSDPTVTRIYTQFALDPRKTMEIARQKNISHAHNSETKNIFIMSSDFFVQKTVGGETKWEVYCYKPKDIYRSAPRTPKVKRTKDLLAIEREYWERLGVKWKLVDRQFVNETEAINLRNFSEEAGRPWEFSFSKEKFVRLFTRYVRNFGSPYLEEAIEHIASTLGIAVNQAFAAFKHLAWHRHIPLDLKQPVLLSRPIPYEYHQHAA